MLIVAQLDKNAIEYSTAFLSNLIGLTTSAIRKHCRELWPAHRGHYYLSFDEAAVLIYRVTKHSQRRKLPDATALCRELMNNGVISEKFPSDAPDIARAANAIRAHRDRRKQERELRLAT